MSACGSSNTESLATDDSDTNSRSTETRQFLQPDPNIRVPFDGVAGSWQCVNGGCASTDVDVRVYQEMDPPPPDHTVDEHTYRSTANAGPAYQVWRSGVDGTGDQMVDVVVELKDPTERQFRDAFIGARDHAERLSLIASRRTQIPSLQSDARRFVQNRGGTIVASFWSSNAFQIELPASALSQLEARSDVLGVWPASTGGVDDQNRPPIDMEDVLDNGNSPGRILGEPYDVAEIYGESHGRTSSPTDNIKLCFVEWYSAGENVVNTSHVAWDDCPGGPPCSGPSRVKTQEICGPSTCITAINNGNSSHVNGTAALAAASIEQGQDSNYPGSNTQPQEQRSGVAQEAHVYTFLARASDQGDGAYRRAFERCVEVGADAIVNASSFDGTSCDPTFNPAGLRSAINTALDAGIPIVSSSGNHPYPGTGCNVTTPAVYPETISVGALKRPDEANGISYGGEPPGSGNTAVGIASRSRRGRALVSSYGGYSYVSTPSITLAAPTNIRRYASSGTSNYASGGFDGTSGSTAVLGGVSGLVLEGLRERFLPDDYRAVNASLGILGDGGISPTAKTRTYVDETFGFGRVKMQLPVEYPNRPGEIRSFHHSVVSGTLDAGQSAYVPTNCYGGGWPVCPDQYTGIKAALFVEDPGRNSSWVPDFNFEIVDSCGGKGVIKSASSSDYLWKRIRVFDTWRFQNTCPELKITLDDNSYYQDVKFAAVIYMFGPENSSWVYH